MNVAETNGRSGMKLKTLMRWTGPAAIGTGVFMVFSGLSGLPFHVPYLSQNDPTGYQVVGSGLILFALTLLLVGMLGLYASQAGSTGARVIESGAGYHRDEGWEPLEEYAHPEEPRRLARHSGVGRAGQGVLSARLPRYLPPNAPRVRSTPVHAGKPDISRR
jgi:hypothetical protein